jgi:DNA primase
LSFPSGRTAEEIVVDDTCGLAWIVNLGCIELHPHPVRSGDLDHPDELRIDLDPIPGVSWDDVRRVALEVQGFLDEVGLRGSAARCSASSNCSMVIDLLTWFLARVICSLAIRSHIYACTRSFGPAC